MFWKFLMFCVLGVFCAIIGFGVFAQEEGAQAIESLFPREVDFTDQGKEYHLQMTGASTRKKFFVTVYHVAHYMDQAGLPQGANKYQEVMQDNRAKQLTMKWVRDVGADKVQEGYRQSFKNALEGRRSNVQNEINNYVQFFNRDVKKGDQHVLRWIPEGKIEVSINDSTPKVIDNKEFAQLLWNIWFGNRSVVNREQLVELMY